MQVGGSEREGEVVGGGDGLNRTRAVLPALTVPRQAN